MIIKIKSIYYKYSNIINSQYSVSLFYITYTDDRGYGTALS